MHRNIFVIGHSSKSNHTAFLDLLRVQSENRMYRQSDPKPVRTFYVSDHEAGNVAKCLAVYEQIEKQHRKILMDHWPHMTSELIITHPYLEKPSVSKKTEFCSKQTVIDALNTYKELGYQVDATYFLSGNIHFSVVGMSGRINILGKFYNR